MTYLVKEIFYTLQGEGANAGRPAVFLRFSNCNFWSGHKRDRKTAICKFCDTDFVGGEAYLTAKDLAERVAFTWGIYGHDCVRDRFVVITGGEPAMQFDQPLLNELHKRHFIVAIETNGSLPLKANPDWITVSPKTKTIRVTDGDELKLVFPTLPPELFVDMSFKIHSLQPKDERWWWKNKRNTKLAVEYCQRNPRWRLSLQIHKILGLR